MMKSLLVFCFCCCTYSAVVADDVLKRIYELDSFETPVSITVVETLVKPDDVRYVAGDDVRGLGQIDLREPAQIFLTQSIPFTPVVCQSENGKSSFPRPRPELRWLMTGSYLQNQPKDHKQGRRLLYGGAIIYE